MAKVKIIALHSCLEAVLSTLITNTAVPSSCLLFLSFFLVSLRKSQLMGSTLSLNASSSLFRFTYVGFESAFCKLSLVPQVPASGHIKQCLHPFLMTSLYGQETLKTHTQPHQQRVSGTSRNKHTWTEHPLKESSLGSGVWHHSG